ncbi:MAG TPA: sugar phosphate nucleotidyltransferase [Candidatus Solibacter sp.]|nr:sugar phosphate nucleotidyltransferase [Candidatus Solibacter sp.]
MIGIIPAAGAGQRIQPLGCSKELLPVGSRMVDGTERPKAVSEYLVERMIAAGAEQICMVISAEKTDIVKYYAERPYAAEIFYILQQKPQGLCDALFRAEPFARLHDKVLIGLPDTIWFPENAYLPALDLGQADVNLVLFPVADPTIFDAVNCDELGNVQEVQVKTREARSHWIWGAVTARGESFHRLKLLWEARHRADEYLGDLLNAFIGAGNAVRGRYSGEVYMDVGTLEGYRNAQDYLRTHSLFRFVAQPSSAVIL